MSSMQGELAIFHDENRLMKFQGKRVQKDVGYDVKFPDENEIENVHGKRSKLGEVSSEILFVEPPQRSHGGYDYTQEPLPDDLSLYPSFLLDSYHDGCDYRCDAFEYHRDVDESLSLIPGMLVPPCLFDFAKEMISKSDDKTVLATHLSRETTEDSHLLELFKSIGVMSSAKLAIDQETGLSGGFGFVTFVTKEDAKKAIDERNGYVYGIGCDKSTMEVDWVAPRTA